MITKRFASLSLLAILLVFGGCTMMQPPQPDPTIAKLEQLDRRLAALERILASGALTELTVQVDELQRDNADLRGRAESLEHDAQGTASRQRDLYVDLDSRIQNLEQNLQSRAVSPAPLAGMAALPVPGGNDRANYEAAFELLKQQRYEAAGAAFAQFLATFPDSQLADNAQYWLAEASYVTDQFEEALAQFQVVLSDYPRSRKIPDALLKIGYSYYELEQWDGARSALQTVRDEHPDSTAARLAEQRLKRMDDEGH
jgi:tol-pal system protein YbgF